MYKSAKKKKKKKRYSSLQCKKADSSLTAASLTTLANRLPSVFCYAILLTFSSSLWGKFIPRYQALIRCKRTYTCTRKPVSTSSRHTFSGLARALQDGGEGIVGRGLIEWGQDWDCRRELNTD